MEDNQKEFETIEEIDKETEKLIALFVSSYAFILKLLNQQINQGLNERQARKLLKRIQSNLQNLDKETLKYVKTVFPQYYMLSLRNIDAVTVEISGVKKISGAKSAIHKKALQQAVNDLYSDIAKNTKFMEQSAKKIIRENAKELLTGMIKSGESQRTIKKKLKEQLLKNGVPIFTDAGKRNWSLDRYTDMLIRTKSRQLHNEGTMERLKEYQETYSEDGEYVEGFDLIQISNHGASDWCNFYEDMVFSVSGKSETYPSIETLPNRPYNTLHPNCKHLFLAYIPSLRGKGKTVSRKYQSKSMSELNRMDYERQKKKKKYH